MCSKLHNLAIIDNHISHVDQFELKLFFASGGAFFSSK